MGDGGATVDPALLGHWEATQEGEPDRVRVHNPAIEFWKRAVRDKIVTGSIEKGEYGDHVAVTASPDEMAAVVKGYGAVLFESDVAFELRRRWRPTPRRP